MLVNSVTVKAGSNPPKPDDPIVVHGWRADGYVGLDRTPEKAENALGVKVARNDDLFNANDFQKYYGRPFVLKSLESTDRVPTAWMLFMMGVIGAGNLFGQKALFTFGKGNYVEKNFLGSFPYATGGFLSKVDMVSYGEANGPLGSSYGTLKLEPGCTRDSIISSGYSKGRGHYKCTLEADQEAANK
eukprot:CAMPEP_0119078154 /NCGR_PEP_ID=MMETSP1178-20130426/98713_1 /TAXON_ID=33656 /ORGANISM="unid sp, Strain CCMP2000" /LENGTH=186 /DNA_ID=CAMNT_0007060579 /DNA_START=76 /DNA_END=636 /DNA_ORIENTATION=-